MSLTYCRIILYGYIKNKVMQAPKIIKLGKKGVHFLNNIIEA